MSSLETAKALSDQGHYPEAWEALRDSLAEENPKAMLLATFILDKKNEPELGYILSKRMTELFPEEPACWTNLGKFADTLWKIDQSIAAYEKSISLHSTDKGRCFNLLNLGSVYMQIGDFKAGKKYSEQALALEPDNGKARHNLGICQLAERDWSGWKNYRASIGTQQRPRTQYADEPLWSGRKVKKLVVTGEQGLGDEICAASMFEDLRPYTRNVVIDCDKRLENLFRRSFPWAKVYGTRWQKDGLDWDEEDTKPDASINSMQIGEYVRRNDKDFPGKPFLTADPDRVAMWKGLWQTKGKPVIGVSWSGGIKSTAAPFRKLDINDLTALLSEDAHFVCLQYKDSEETCQELRNRGVDIKQYSFATLSKDYDDTAALIASLPKVVTMQSTVVHTAGALGVPCAALIPTTSQWRYGEAGESMPWYGSVRLFRQQTQGDWGSPIEQVKEWMR